MGTFTFIRGTAWLVGKTIKLALLLAETPWWLLHLSRHAATKTLDAAKATPALAAGLRCPNGHAVPTDNITCTCSACGYTYVGSVFRCANPECFSRSAAFTDCPICGLSTRSPYRWGRP